MLPDPRKRSRILDQLAYLNGVGLDFSRPGKPTDNALIESFNGRFRKECLNENWFLSLEDAREKTGIWRERYNEIGPTVPWAIWPRWSLPRPKGPQDPQD